MVRGMFPREEQESVLSALEQSVVFVDGENIERLLWDCNFHYDAWVLANLYLVSVGAEPLGQLSPADLTVYRDDCRIYVLPRYLVEKTAFADALVYEAAHRLLFRHLDPDGGPWWKSEVFASSCEVHACILARAGTAAERTQLAWEYGSRPHISDKRVDPREVAEIVREAVAATNGWEVILARHAVVRLRRGIGASLTAFRAALAIAERLVQQDPSNSRWQRDLILSHDKVGDLLDFRGDTEGALRCFQASLAIAERLAEQKRGDSERQEEVAMSCFKLARASGPDEARPLLERARTLLLEIAAASRLTHQQEQWLAAIDDGLASLPGSRAQDP